MVTPSFKPHVILGTMTFGTGSGGRISDRAVIQEILDIFKAHGHTELDTARNYTQGNTEEVLNELGVFNQGFQVHTKAFPVTPGNHEPEKLKATVSKSLKALGVGKVDVLYLHAPDHATPFEKTLRAVQDLYEQGAFTELGLSNFAAWEVMQVYQIAKANNYVLPSIYQGMYNALTRDVEKELFPCLRELGIRFVAYNPLAGGILSGHHKFELDPEQGARFDPKTTQGERYRERYWNTAYFDAVELVKAAVSKHEGITLVNASHRWIFHHSKIDQSKGDGVIIGVSSVKHAKQNLSDCEDGPLPEDIVSAFDEAYARTKALQVNYFR
ncbi:NADP-dependent oxidoreductase domain-containing protein [Obelidium mucronatum]|nr:NADP-dependent oxidoreductase domain-containing protein [Obelidium mucronatum]